MIADYLVVGAGLTGATIARTLSDAGRDVLVLERRGHIGGNLHELMHHSERAAAVPGLVMCGRLGDYRYYDMDQAIGRALRLAKRALGQDAGAVRPAPALVSGRGYRG